MIVSTGPTRNAWTLALPTDGVAGHFQVVNVNRWDDFVQKKFAQTATKAVERKKIVEREEEEAANIVEDAATSYDDEQAPSINPTAAEK